MHPRSLWAVPSTSSVAATGSVSSITSCASHPGSGQVVAAGRLPAASSDSSAAVAGATAYVVGGYTGTSWLDTVVAFTPGRAARVVGHLPVGVRYAAVTAVGASLVIAGGTLPDGTASRTVYLFDTRRHTTRRIASLAAATTHAAAATLGDTAFIIGGDGSVLGSMSAAVIAIRPATGHSAAGHLSSLAAISPRSRSEERIVIAGGMTAHGVTDRISALVPQARKRSGRSAAAPRERVRGRRRERPHGRGA